MCDGGYCYTLSFKIETIKSGLNKVELKCCVNHCGSATEGHYTFSSVPPGDYTLHASKRHYTQAPSSVTLLPGQRLLSHNITLTAVTYSRSFTLQNSVTGASLTEGKVTLTGPQHNPQTNHLYSQQDGSASFQDLAPGIYSMTVTRAGFETHTQTLIIDSEIETPHTTTLTPLYGGLTTTFWFGQPWPS